MFRLNALVPELSVSDINRSLNFYLNILYFKLEYQRPENKFAMISLDGCQIMIEEIRRKNQYTSILERLVFLCKFFRLKRKLSVDLKYSSTTKSRNRLRK